MAENSKIKWCDATFNPWIGCSKVSPGCANCYAESYGKRFGVKWGLGKPRKRTKAGYWQKATHMESESSEGYREDQTWTMQLWRLNGDTERPRSRMSRSIHASAPSPSARLLW